VGLTALSFLPAGDRVSLRRGQAPLFWLFEGLLSFYSPPRCIFAGLFRCAPGLQHPSDGPPGLLHRNHRFIHAQNDLQRLLYRRVS
jgi:hypothetical protein